MFSGQSGNASRFFKGSTNRKYSFYPHCHYQLQKSQFPSQDTPGLQFAALLGSIRHVLVSYSFYCHSLYVLTSPMALPYHHITFHGSMAVSGLGTLVIYMICSYYATVSYPATLDQSLTRSRKAVITYPALRQQCHTTINSHLAYKPRLHLNLIFYLYTPPARHQGLTCQQLASSARPYKLAYPRPQSLFPSSHYNDNYSPLPS